MFTKKTLIGLLAIITLAVSAITMAFTERDTPSTSNLLAETWYFNPVGSSTDVDLPQNYSRSPNGAQCGAEEGPVCTIQDIANSTNDHPAMSNGLVSTDTNDAYSKTYKEL